MGEGLGQGAGIGRNGFERAMVRAEEIASHDDLSAWLEEQTEAVVQDIARTSALMLALRVVPFAIRRYCDDTAINYFNALAVFRCALTAHIKIKEPNIDVSFDYSYGFTGQDAKAFDPVWGRQRADEAVRTASTFSASPSRAAIAELIRCANEAVHASAEMSNFSSYFGVGGQASIWPQLASDLSRHNGRMMAENQGLWSIQPPDTVLVCWQDVLGFMQRSAGGFSFWVRWYEALLAGRPLTGDWHGHWQLMHDIALIAPEDWDKGAEHVADVIDLISQKHALQRDVAQIKRALENEIFNAETLGRHRDNLPDDLPRSRIVEYRTALKELQIELDAVEEALEPPVPDAEVLEQATGRLRAVWGKIKKYPVAVAFVTLIGAAATGAATTAGSRGMDWFLDHDMPQLIRGLKDIAPKQSEPPKASKSWEKPSVDL